MEFALWSLIVGFLLVVLALSGTVLQRLPLSTAMVYLGVGLAVSPLGIGLIEADAKEHTEVLERLNEVVVLLSLFTSGLKLSAGLRDRSWLLPLRLALGSMVVTVALITAAAYFLLGLPLGAAILLGGILAPTDPVLAADVQVTGPNDGDGLRFALTGEGGLNDGTAMPFVLLGLGLLGLHDLGQGGWRWWAVDVLWAAAGGLGAGALLGIAVGRLVLFLRREHKEAVGLDDFLALGLVGLTYGATQLMHANGFLAVFAAGVALRHLEQSQTESPEAAHAAVQKAIVSPDTELAEKVAVDPRHAPAYMAKAVLGFNEQIERIAEVAAVMTIGALLWHVPWQPAGWWLVPLVLLLVRPISVALGLAGSAATPRQRRLIGWFGIRGVGSLFYLTFALNHGVRGELADQLIGLVLSVVVASILVHGISVSPLMARYERAARRKR
jgi:NhaP-type Na+/H+ or K+/H+ antiporter